MTEPIDTTNKFFVAVNGAGQFVFLRPIPQLLSEADALLLAAWIVAMCPDDDRWKATLQAVCNT